MNLLSCLWILAVLSTSCSAQSLDLPFTVYDHTVTVFRDQVYLVGGKRSQGAGIAILKPTASMFDNRTRASSTSSVWKVESFPLSDHLVGHDTVWTSLGLTMVMGQFKRPITSNSSILPGVVTINEQVGIVSNVSPIINVPGRNASSINNTVIPYVGRYHQAVAYDTEFQRLLIYGGQVLPTQGASFDLFYSSLNSTQMVPLTAFNASSTTQINNPPHPGFKRASMVKMDYLVLVCFGMNERDEAVTGCSLFNLVTLKWSPTTVTSASSPSARIGHVMFRHPKEPRHYIVYGGADPLSQRVLNDIWVLDATQAPTLSWTRIDQNKTPFRYRHAGFLLGNEYIVVGGCSQYQQDEETLVGENTVFSLDLLTLLSASKSISGGSVDMTRYWIWLIPVIVLVGLLSIMALYCFIKKRRDASREQKQVEKQPRRLSMASLLKRTSRDPTKTHSLLSRNKEKHISCDIDFSQLEKEEERKVRFEPALTLPPIQVAVSPKLPSAVLIVPPSRTYSRTAMSTAPTTTSSTASWKTAQDPASSEEMDEVFKNYLRITHQL